MSQSLAEVLGRYLHRSYSSVNRIAILSKVPRQTIANWLDGRIKKPRRWQDVIKVAAALDLSTADANTLLKAARQRPIEQLRSMAVGADRKLLAPFDSPANAHQAAPFQAIIDLPTFVGREAELADLKRAILFKGQAAICGVQGMGGVGKTTLAAHIAYQLRTEFPDGVLWARVDTSDALTILAQFADAFGKDVRDYYDLDSRAAVVRTLLSDKQVLIILDNAEASDQVRHLLPPSTGRNAVVITTRNDLSALDGWSRLTLQPFEATSSDALDLFARHLDRDWVTRHAADLSVIATQVGGLPLALAILAGQLRSQPDTLLTDLLVQLRESDTRLSALTREDRNLRASFDVSYVRLPPESQIGFSTLGIFGGEDFSIEAAAQALGRSIDWTQVTLNQLIGFSLVQPARLGRYRLHPLLRDYAREKLVSDEADRVPVRLMEFYIHTIDQRGPQGYGALALEIGNIDWVLEIVHARQWPTLFVRGASAVIAMYTALGLYPKLEILIVRALQAVELIDDVALRAKWLYQVAEFENDSRLRPAQAEDYAQQALGLARQLADWQLTCDTLVLLSGIAWSSEDLERTTAFAAEAERLARQHGFDDVLISVARDRGWRALWQGDFDLAETNIRADLNRARRKQNVHDMRAALNGLGYVLHRRGQYAEADACYAESLAMSEQANGLRPVHTLRARTENALAWGKLQEAEQYADETLQAARHSGKPDEIINAQIYAGDVALARADYARADDLWQASYELTQNLSPMKHYAVVCRLGRLYLEQNQLSQAGCFLQDADAWTRSIEHNDSLRWYLCYDLARLALMQGRLIEAESYAEESLLRCEKLKLREAIEAQALLKHIRSQRDHLLSSV